MKCEDNLDGVFSADYSPDTPAERADLATRLQQLAQSCEARSGNLLPYVSSESSVRDMDRIRQAVGDKKLTYLGYSYGTYLGTLYAKLFPSKVRALVLDGAIDPNLSAVEVGAEQAGGFERSLDAFLADCSANRRCSFNNAGDSAGAFDRLAAQVDAQPVPAGNGRTLGGGEFDLGVAQALYSGKEGYTGWSRRWRAPSAGDGSRLLALSDEYTGRQRQRQLRLVAARVLGHRLSRRTVGRRAGRLHGRGAAIQRGCAARRSGAPQRRAHLRYWPVPPVANEAPIHVDGTPPILVVGTTNDPATPLKWAQGLSQELTSAVLLTAVGTQHTAFVTALNQCVDDHVVTYLVDLKPPPKDTTCGS